MVMIWIHVLTYVAKCVGRKWANCMGTDMDLPN